MTENKKAGRPVVAEKDKRSKVVQFRCTTHELLIMKRAASQNDLSLTDWLRRSVLKEAN